VVRAGVSSVEQGAVELWFEVSDSGIGIPPGVGAEAVPTFQPGRCFDGAPFRRDRTRLVISKRWLSSWAERSRSKARSGAALVSVSPESSRTPSLPPESLAGRLGGLPDSGGDWKQGDPPDGQRATLGHGGPSGLGRRWQTAGVYHAILVDGKEPGPRDGRCPSIPGWRPEFSGTPVILLHRA